MTTYFIMFDRDMHKGRKGSQAPFSKAGSKTSFTNVFGSFFLSRSHLLFFLGGLFYLTKSIRHLVSTQHEKAFVTRVRHTSHSENLFRLGMQDY